MTPLPSRSQGTLVDDVSVSSTGNCWVSPPTLLPCPPFERVVPDPAKCQPFYLNAPAWQAALPALVPIARENSNRITVEIEGARAVLSARSEGLGEVSADVEVAGGAVGARFAINVRYLALALSHVQNDSDNVTLHYQAADRALLFGSAVHRAVVMPMAL